MRRPLPNTGDPYKGKTPAQLNYQDCLENHYCVRCRQRWVEANKLMCEKCIGEVQMYRARVKRKKDPMLKDRKAPLSVEIVLVKELHSNSYAMSVLSDIGNLLTVHRLESVDIRDAREGKVEMISYRPTPKIERKQLMKSISNRRYKTAP